METRQREETMEGKMFEVIKNPNKELESSSEVGRVLSRYRILGSIPSTFQTQEHKQIYPESPSTPSLGLQK